jgi:trans-aconitate methyltransferase
MATFDSVSKQYEKKSLVQKKAAGKLIELLGIKNYDSVIDIACGPGHITGELKKLTNGKAVGIDKSGCMIEQAKKAYPGIEFRNIPAEELDYSAEFDIAFCNSALQWFAEPKKSVKLIYKALRKNGRLGVACPGTANWAPFFWKVLEKLKKTDDFKKLFSCWKNPWFILSSKEDYKYFFENCGFKTAYISVDYEANRYSAEKAFEVFLSGAANAFNEKQYYGIEIDDDYVRRFNAGVKEEFIKAAIKGKVTLDFNRLYYIGEKT